ncbi:MAG: sigma factor, partial [Bacteroidota bacterium]
MSKNKELFLDIIEDHKRILYKIAQTYCKEQQDREDLIQEMILQ